MFNQNPGSNPNAWANPYSQPTAPQWALPQLKTNKILVTSLEEAIAKSTDRFSEMYYFDQNKPVFYIIRTGMDMIKTWLEVPYILPDQEINTPVTKADLATLEARISALENKTVQKKNKSETAQEVTKDVEST
jgi:hypothetical protein